MKLLKLAIAATAIISSAVAVEIKCGKDVGSCPLGYCCSKDGICGKTTKYCNAGCQPEYGSCAKGNKIIFTKKVVSNKKYVTTKKSKYTVKHIGSRPKKYINNETIYNRLTTKTVEEKITPAPESENPAVEPEPENPAVEPENPVVKPEPEIEDAEEADAEDDDEDVNAAGEEEKEKENEPIENEETTETPDKKISTNGKCGKEDGSCPKGQCCSQWGYCGTGDAFCGESNCLPEFGDCGIEEPAQDDTEDQSKKISTNGQCGPEYGICPDGLCCSQWGWCGSTSAHCAADGCLSDFGKCDEPVDPNDDTRESTDGQCGKGHGVCPDGQCCSSNGICGITMDFCGTGCQTEFGECGQSAVDNAVVEGFSYYKECVSEYYWALTFDDGPYIYDHKLLDLLKEKGIKATFFVTGISAMGIETEEAKEILKRMDAEGHIIASHTWTHLDLTTLTEDEVEDEMRKLEDVIEAAIGKKPAFVRPPFGSGENRVKLAKKLRSLGYTAAVTWNVDTMDWSNKGDIDYAISKFKENLGNSALSLNHVNYEGITQEKLLKLVEAEIDYMLGEDYLPVTMDVCLNLPAYQ